MWDDAKYFDSEEPFIYQADTQGTMERHLAVDISDCLSIVAEHLDDLCFVYGNPSNAATIDELEAVIPTLTDNKVIQKY